VYEVAAKFAFHHVNAYETASGALVVDTFARDSIDFGGDLTTFSTDMYKRSDTKTTWRRIVCRGQEKHAVEHDLCSVPALDRVIEFPAQVPPEHAGKPVSPVFCQVRRASCSTCMVFELITLQACLCNVLTTLFVVRKQHMHETECWHLSHVLVLVTHCILWMHLFS
jgi:carotenoid cleavage dioxygenase-like enzyme